MVLRHVDRLDVLLSLCFGEKYLSKEERIQRAKQLQPKVFDLGFEEKNNIIEDVLKIYEDSEYSAIGISTRILASTKDEAVWWISRGYRYFGWKGKDNGVCYKSSAGYL